MTEPVAACFLHVTGRMFLETLPASRAAVVARELTVIVPAYNEAASIGDTIRSLQAQTVRIKAVIVVDDCSTDDTAAVARSLGATVVRPPSNTGSKAGAQNFALSHVQSDFTMAIDADTTLAPDAVEKLLAAFDDPQVVAACGFVEPRYRQTMWERGRYIEYLLAFTFYKPIQDFYGKPLISSGCFSAYRTDVLKACGGWSTRTMAEDVDLTWRFYFAGHRVRFVPEAVCYPIEPHDFHFMRKQLKRWSHGFIQNVRLHWRSVLHVPYLRSTVAVAMWDAVIASFGYLVLIPLLTILFMNPLFLLAYLLDAPVVLIPVLVAARRSRGVGEVFASLPAFFLLRTVNSVFILEALWSELILRRPLLVYEKGH
jgi:biofilm PGA synthesis N-glycosyltransferase PgaC